MLYHVAKKLLIKQGTLESFFGFGRFSMLSLFEGMDKLDKLFVVWAFLFQVILIIHFAIRKPLFESYTEKYGWIVYALCIPAAIISIILLRGGKTWHTWLGDSCSLSMPFLAFGLIMWRKSNSGTRLKYRSSSPMFSYIWQPLCSTGGRCGL